MAGRECEAVRAACEEIITAGISIRAAAKKHGCTRGGIYAALKRRNAKTPGIRRGPAHHAYKGEK